MAFSDTNKPKIDILQFIFDTFNKTVSASRSRLVIFGIILFLQFMAIPLITFLTGHHYPGSYEGLIRKNADEAGLRIFFDPVKYLLLIVLLIISPGERSGRRRVAKYIVLLGSLYVWFVLDVMSFGFEDDDRKAQLAQRSFVENAIPIYGKVVFASFKYNRSKGKNKFGVAVAEKLSPQTDGYIVIVQLNDSFYTYHGLKMLYHNFNDFTLDRFHPTNIQEKVPNLSNCLRFICDFPSPLKSPPDLPAVDKYVKIMYDPKENGIEMYTDSTTAVTPSFDSIPGINNAQRSKLK